MYNTNQHTQTDYDEKARRDFFEVLELFSSFRTPTGLRRGSEIDGDCNESQPCRGDECQDDYDLDAEYCSVSDEDWTDE